MRPYENANNQYSRLNVPAEEVNRVGLTQLTPLDIMRKIMCPSNGQIWTHCHRAPLS